MNSAIRRAKPGNLAALLAYLRRSNGVNSTRWAEPLLAANARAGSAGEIILDGEDDDKAGQLTVDALNELGYVVLDDCGGAAPLDSLAPDGAELDPRFTDIVMPGLNECDLAGGGEFDHDPRQLLAVVRSRWVAWDDGRPLGAR